MEQMDSKILPRKVTGEISDLREVLTIRFYATSRPMSSRQTAPSKLMLSTVR